MISEFKFLLLLLVFSMLLETKANAQQLNGAWKLMSQNGNPFTEGEMIKIYSDSYFMFGHYAADGRFIKAGGGKYTAEGKSYNEVLDFNTADSTVVRQPRNFSFKTNKDELTINALDSGSGMIETWKRVDDSSSRLKGAWRFGSRVDDDGKAGPRRGDVPRQTIKILSGNHFQWAAFNYETKQFSGTGGGTYVIADGKYTETIKFFSRDNSKVGISLTFDYKLDGTDWYHKGKGTTGNPVSEVWEKMK